MSELKENNTLSCAVARDLMPLYVENLTEEERQQLREKQAILKLIDEKPAEVALLIKTWLTTDE